MHLHWGRDLKYLKKEFIVHLFLSTGAHSESTPRNAVSLDDYFRAKQGENVGLLFALQISNVKHEVYLYLIFPNNLEPTYNWSVREAEREVLECMTLFRV